MNESRKEIGEEIAYLKKLNAATTACTFAQRQGERERQKRLHHQEEKVPAKPNQAKPTEPSDQATYHTHTYIDVDVCMCVFVT